MVLSRYYVNQNLAFMARYFVSSLFLILIFNSCKRSPFDYRNKFEGEYKFTTTVQTWDANMNDSIITFLYDGTVYYDKENAKDEINISIGSLQKFTATIDREGNLFSCGGTGKIIKKESVTFDYNTSLCKDMQLEENIVYHLSGIKF